MFNLSSANVFNLVMFKILSFGKELLCDKLLPCPNQAGADDNVNVTQNMKFVIHRVENLVNQALLTSISPFPKMFSESSFIRLIESQDCEVKNKG